MDSEEKAFLAEIEANYKDAFLKLVYADWLEERGDPLADGWRWIAENDKFPTTEYESFNPNRDYGVYFDWLPGSNIMEEENSTVEKPHWFGLMKRSKHQPGVYRTAVAAFQELAEVIAIKELTQ